MLSSVMIFDVFEKELASGIVAGRIRTKSNMESVCSGSFVRVKVR